MVKDEGPSTKAKSLMTGMLSTRDSKNSPNDDPSTESGPKIDFLKDDFEEMTFERRLALKLIDKPWYNPMCKQPEDDSVPSTSKASPMEKGDGEDKTNHVIDDFDKDLAFDEPCLALGWAFFEHQTLYRYLLPKENDRKEKKDVATRAFRQVFLHRNKKFEKAEPGEDEQPSRLYPNFTPHNQLGDFGLGVGLYFSTLRALIFISLLCGFISLGNIIYFGSENYDGNNDFNSLGGFFLMGSAVCSDMEWVPCPTCNCRDEGESRFLDRTILIPDRCAIANATDGTRLLFALRNKCDGTRVRLAACNFATVIVMVLSLFMLGKLMKREIVKFDEDEQTAQDYSIQIRNPPGDAKDPEEWRRFFKENCDDAQVVVCTCAVENDLLVKTLVERRELFRKINCIQPGKSMDMLDLAKDAAHMKRERTSLQHLLANVVPGLPEFYDRLVNLKGRVEGLAQLEYPVTNVFVTFETEEDQRRVLEKLSVGYTNAKNKNADALSDPKYLFRGEIVLDVCEPEEPSTIIWQDLNAKLGKRLKGVAVTITTTLLLLFLIYYCIYYINRVNTLWATYTITLVNVLFPVLAKLKTEKAETHQTESQKQTSLYVKIALFRWVTGVIIFAVIVPFTETITHGKSGLLVKVYSLFFSDITLGHLMPVLDLPGRLKRHYLAPRAKTQDKMNTFFLGTPYELAEKYTDMAKVFFLCLFYCSIFPSAFFLCAISLSVKYFVDRYTLVRIWERAPAIGPIIATINRKFILSLAVGIMAIMCSYYWTGFPYDNLCPADDGEVDTSYVGTFTVSTYPGYNGPNATNIWETTVDSEDVSYEFCAQNFFVKFVFPFVPSLSNRDDLLDPDKYMTDAQIFSTTIFGWSAFGLMILIILKWCWNGYTEIKKSYSGGHKAIGESQGIPYSEVLSRSAYIPQVNSTEFAFPLIACKVDDLDEEVFCFNDTSRCYKYYDLTKDAKKLLAAINLDDPPGFSVVKTWTAENVR